MNTNTNILTENKQFENLEEHQKRTTCVHFRFQVTHPEFGFMESFSKFTDAVLYCFHPIDDNEQRRFEIFDLMAVKGTPQLWDYMGNVKERKPYPDHISVADAKTEMAIDKILNKITIENDGCWKWQGVTNNSGYGAISFKGKWISIHRFMWIFEHGYIPEGKQVCHTCDNRFCCNPDHLFIGTPQDNVNDMIAKGRKADLSGENNSQAKLTKLQVQEIRKGLDQGISQKELAQKYNIARSQISSIKHGYYWRQN